MPRALSKLLVSLVVTVLLLVALEGVSSFVLACRPKAAPKSAEPGGRRRGSEIVNVFEFDEDLGWRYRPSLRLEDFYGPGLWMTTNAQGLRATREYALGVPEGLYRVLCLGDSFTMGYGVGDDETYPAQLEALAPGLQAVNMGCGAYSAGQVYLRYVRDGTVFETDVLLFGLIGDDFRRMLPKNRAAGNAPKPILELRDGEIHAELMTVAANEKPSGFNKFLKGLSVSRLIADLAGEGLQPNASKRPYAAVSEAMFRDLVERSRAQEQLFVVTYFPTLDETVEDSFVLDTWLAEFLDGEGIPWIDLRPAFRALPYSERRTLYLPDGHLTVRGNRVAAEAILDGLRALDPRCPVPVGDR